MIDTFLPQALFNYLDNGAKSFLTIHDFIGYLKYTIFHYAISNLQMNYSIGLLKKIIEIFDKDKDYSISFKEFISIIVPKYNPEILSKCLNIPHYTIDQYNIDIPFSSIVLFTSIIEYEMTIQEIINNNSIETQKNGFMPIEAFAYISKGANYITRELLNEFLNCEDDNSDHSKKYSNDEISYLIFRLDFDNDNEISFLDFKNLFSPIVIQDNNDLYNKTINIVYSPQKKSYNNHYLIKRNNLSDVLLNNNPRNIICHDRSTKTYQLNTNNNSNFTMLSSENVYNDWNYSLQQMQPNAININEGIEKKRTMKTIRLHLYHCFSNLIKYETENETLKESLCLRNDINDSALFAFFSINRSNTISNEEILVILKTFGYFLSENSIRLLFNRYDLNKDGLLE